MTAPSIEPSLTSPAAIRRSLSSAAAAIADWASHRELHVLAGADLAAQVGERAAQEAGAEVQPQHHGDVGNGLEEVAPESGRRRPRWLRAPDRREQ